MIMFEFVYKDWPLQRWKDFKTCGETGAFHRFMLLITLLSEYKPKFSHFKAYFLEPNTGHLRGAGRKNTNQT